MMGATQKEAGVSVGRHEDTIGSWEKEGSWTDARAEARERWMADLDDESRRVVITSVRMGNAEMGWRFLERTDPRLAPPRQKHELTGKDGEPLAPSVVVLPAKEPQG